MRELLDVGVVREQLGLDLSAWFVWLSVFQSSSRGDKAG